MNEPTQKRTGRPLKSRHEKRVAQRKIRFTLAENEYLELQASRAGLTVAELIRRAALGIKIQPPRTRDYAQVIFELNASGINLNQIARALNRGQQAPSYLEAAIAKHLQILDEVTARDGP